MSVADARRFEGGSRLQAEVCIVGAGAAGITLANALDEAGLDVCLIESGGLRPEHETQALYDLDSVGYPVREHYMSRVRQYGGSCNLWAGRSMRLQEADLRERPWVPHSGWPVTYHELSPHYPKASGILGLPSADWFDADGERVRREVSPEERRLSVPESLAFRVALWASKPMRFGRRHYRRIVRSQRIRLVLHANAVHVQLRPDGHAVDSIRVATLGGKELRVVAKLFVLACGGIENARLMLASRDVHAAGVGNAFDLVGRYFMDHPRTVFGRVHLRPGARLRLMRGRPVPGGSVQVGIGFSAELQAREGLLNHYGTFESERSRYVEAGYRSFVDTMKIVLRKGYVGSRMRLGRSAMAKIPELIYLLTPKELMPHVVYRWQARLRELTGRDRVGGSYVVVYFCEQPPNPESRVVLGSDMDRLGMPRAVLDWRLGTEVERGVRRLQELLGRALEASELGSLERGDGEPGFSDASHHMGTTRMSATPSGGVVDPDGRVHGIANLYVAGSSVFPSAGHANPTLTIVALTLRLAEHLSSSWT